MSDRIIIGARTVESSCNLGNGSATLLVNGGTVPYFYNWSNGGTNNFITNVFPGGYSVTITDLKNCTKIVTATVTMNSLPVINSFISSPEFPCSGNPIMLNVNASGGTFQNVFSSGNVNVAIPDNNFSGVSSTIHIISGLVLNNADDFFLTLNFGTGALAPNREHRWVGDLKIALSSPGGSTIVFDRPGIPQAALGTNGDMNGSYIFTTTATDILPQTTTSPLIFLGNVANGSYKPTDSSNPDSPHNWAGLTFPMSVNGNWTLTISDNSIGNVGDLVSWSVSFPTFYTHAVTGPGTIGDIICLNSDCSNANVVVTNAPTGNIVYSIVTTSPDGCTASANANLNTSCGNTLNLKVFLEGYYRSTNTMIAVVDPVLHPTLCDTITLELREAIATHNLAFSTKDTIDIHGMGTFRLPDAILNKSYYLIIKHHNSIDIWSKNPIMFSANEMSFDFTTP